MIIRSVSAGVAENRPGGWKHRIGLATSSGTNRTDHAINTQFLTDLAVIYKKPSVILSRRARRGIINDDYDIPATWALSVRPGGQYLSSTP